MHSSLQPYLDRVNAGHLRMVEQGPLVLFGYNDKCTYDKAWDEYTLQARGHIFEKATGVRVARPFDKFFNYSERAISDSHQEALALGYYYIQRKEDGSLGIIYYYDGKWNVATRGSFTSEQALRATAMLDKYDMTHADTHLTYLVEIIYPENKIIVPYGEREELVLLAVRNTQTGAYEPQSTLEGYGFALDMSVTPHCHMFVNEALEKSLELPHTEEGWVVVFHDGFRLKIKGANYLRIAKFKANLSPLAVWEAMYDGSIDAMKVACPEEILGELIEMEGRLGRQLALLDAAYWDVRRRLVFDDPRDIVARTIKAQPAFLQAALFASLSGRDYSTMLLKLIRPTGNQYATLPEGV